jgi:hypothetical protein
MNKVLTNKIGTIVIVGNGFDLAHGLNTRYSDFIEWVLPKLRPRKEITDNPLPNPYTVEYENSFINACINSPSFVINKEPNRNARWVDMEQVYFDTLTKQKGDVDSFHKDVQSIIDWFPKFFREITQPTSIPALKKHLQSLDIPIVINFNYTPTIEQYVDKTKVVYIHGDIQNPIFGFSDEDALSEIANSTERIKYSKWTRSFPQIQRVVSITEAQKYRVLIIGHSCGQSDKSVLSTILANDNCTGIDMYYRNNDDDKDKKNRIDNLRLNLGHKILLKIREHIPFPSSKIA